MKYRAAGGADRPAREYVRTRRAGSKDEGALGEMYQDQFNNAHFVHAPLRQAVKVRQINRMAFRTNIRKTILCCKSLLNVIIHQ